MVDAPGLGREVAKKGSEQARCEGLVVDGTHGKDFKAENGAGEWCSEDRAKACGNTAHEQDASLARVEAKRLGELVCERCAGLDGGAFASGRASEEVCEEGSDEDERRHADGDDFRWGYGPARE